jgi:hypothetical protein
MLMMRQKIIPFMIITIIGSIHMSHVVGQFNNNHVDHMGDVTMEHQHEQQTQPQHYRTNQILRRSRHLLPFDMERFHQHLENDGEQHGMINQADDTSGLIRIGNTYQFFPQNINYVTNQCPVSLKKVKYQESTSSVSSSSSSSSYEPECILENDQRGSWICRTLYDVVTGIPTSFSACIDPEHSLETDTCGCCHQTCPDPILCPCDLLNEKDQQGVYVMNVMDDIKPTTMVTTNVRTNEATSLMKCIDPYHSYQLIAGPGFGTQPSCYTEC